MKSNHNDCATEALEKDYLYIKSSQLPNAGMGLFTSIDINKGEIISIFKGEILSEKQIEVRVKNNKDKYFIELLNGSIMDSAKTKCYAKYANDALGYTNLFFKNNAKIAVTNNDEVCIIAIRNIKKDEEIFCNYGKSYWLKHNPN